MALTDLAIRHARLLGKAYRLSDCHGLYIQVNPSGSKLWYLKFRFGNKKEPYGIRPLSAHFSCTGKGEASG